VVRLVRDHQILASGNAKLDMHDRRNRAIAVLGALIDVNPTRGDPFEDAFKIRSA
jgi:hypothetical protein